jgi:hypothetical protein
MVAAVRLQVGHAHRGKVVTVAIDDSQFRILHAGTQLSAHPEPSSRRSPATARAGTPTTRSRQSRAAADPAPLVERFFAGWVPAGLDQSRLEDLRLWWAHGILWWAGLSLSLGADPDVDLTDVYAATWRSLQNGDPVSWLSRDVGTAAP